MGFFSTLKSWFTTDTKKKQNARNQKTYGGSTVSVRNAYKSTATSAKDEEEKRRNQLLKQSRQQQEARTKSLASLSAKTDSKLSPKVEQYNGRNTVDYSQLTGRERAIKKIEKKAVAPNYDKANALEDARKRREEALAKLNERNKSFNEATNYKYDVERNGLKARQAIKSGDYMGDVNVDKYNIDNHKYAESFGRGFMSGATFGGSELVAKYAPRSEEQKEAEKYYQEHKSSGAEVAGDMVGSMLGFGASQDLSKMAVKGVANKLAPKAIENYSSKAVEKLMTTKAMQSIAKKEAVKRFGVKGATKAVVSEIARRRASGLVAELGTDFAINVTTGAISDINRALIDSKNGEEFAKNMGISALTNLGLGAVTSTVPHIRVGRGKQYADRADELAENAIRRANHTKAKKGEAYHAIETPTNFNPKNIGRNAIGESLEDVAEKTALDGVSHNADKVAETTVKAEPLPKATVASKNYVPDDITGDIYKEQALREAQLNDNANDLYKGISDKYGLDDVATPKEELKLAKNEDEVFPQDVEAISKIHQEETDTPTHLFLGTKETSLEEHMRARQEYHEANAKEGYTKLSRVAVSQLPTFGSDTERAIRDKLVADKSLYYEAYNKKELYEGVARKFADEATSTQLIGRILGFDPIKGFDHNSKDTVEWLAACNYLMTTIGKNVDATPENQFIFEQAFLLSKELSSTAGQSLALRRGFVHLSPLSRVDSTLDDLAKILDNSIGYRKQHKDLPKGKFDRLNAIKAELLADNDIMNGLKKLADTKLDEKQLSEAYEEAFEAFNAKNPMTTLDVINEIRYLNMLGNPKTHIRNVVGNLVFNPIRNISNAISDGIIEHISKSKGIELTRKGGLSLELSIDATRKNPVSEYGIEAKKAFEEFSEDIIGDSKYNLYDYRNRSNNKLLKFYSELSSFNSKMLKKEDDIFRERAFRESYSKSYKYYAEQGLLTDKVLHKIAQDAIEEAKIATFSEYNSLATALSKISRNATSANATTLQRAGGIATNALMPFEKVPMNIAKQSLNYSPLGIVKGFVDIEKACKNGNVDMLQGAIDRLASGLTGTGIMGLGLFFGTKTDIFHTNVGKNDPSAKFQKAQGVQDYSVVVTNPSNGKKYSITLDWLTPTTCSFFVGVEMANQFKQGNINLLDLSADWGLILSRVVEPVFETTMLSSVTGMFDTLRSGYGEDSNKGTFDIIAREIAQSYINQLISPTLARQIARTAYSSDKQISGDTDWEYFKNSTKANLGLGADNAITRALGIEPLGADTDAYGNVKGEKKNGLDIAKSALNNFLSPANIREVNLSELDEEKIRLYNEGIKNGKTPDELSYLFPKKSYNRNPQIGGEKTAITPTELTSYNRAKTTGGEEGMRTALDSIIFNRSDSAMTTKEKKRLMLTFKNKSIRDVEEWLYKRPEFKNATEAERKKVINNLWNYSQDGRPKGSKKVGEEAVLKSRGKTDAEARFVTELTEAKRNELQPYIDNGTLTYEDVIDFVEKSPKVTYKETDDGGSKTENYNKAEMIQYIVDNDIPHEKAEALFNIFKRSNAKPYSGTSGAKSGGSSGGRRSSSGGSSKKSKKAVTVKKAKKITGLKDGVSLPTKSTKASKQATIPTLERVKVKTYLPTKNN